MRKLGHFKQKLLASRILKILGLVLFCGLLVYILQSPLFVVKNINCKTQYGPCAKFDEEQLAWVKGENLFFVNTSKVIADLGKLFTNRRVYVEKVFPNSLTVSIEKRKAVIAVKNQLREDLYLADADGQIIETVKQSYLPTLKVENGKFTVGGNLDQPQVRAVKILYLTYKAHGTKEGQIERDLLVVNLPVGVVVYYPLERDPAVLVGALQLILTRSRIEGKLPKVIDLRYSKPVLTYGQVESSSGN